MTGNTDSNDERGLEMTAPDDISHSGWWAILLRVKARFGEDHISVFAAGVAFFGLLALFPAVAATISLAALAVEPGVILAEIEALTSRLPPAAGAILQGQASEVAAAIGPSMGLAAAAGLLLTLYSASKGVKVLIEGMNLAYRQREERGFLHLNLLAFGLTLAMIFALLVAMGLLVAGPALLDSLGLSQTGQTVLGYGRWIVLGALALFGLAVLYRYGPSRANPGGRWVSPGSLVATLLWIAGSAGFSFYVGNFGSYNETYGALGGVIILLTWLWLSAFAVLLGAELNSEIERQAGREPSEPASSNSEAGRAL